MEVTGKRFEELTLNELYAILHCRAQVFVVGQEIVYQDMDYLDQQCFHLFFRDGEKIASYLRIIDPGVKYPEFSIGRVLTMPEYRGQGLARKLMLGAIAEIRKTGRAPIKIEAQTYLKNFYESIGFKPIGEEFNLEGIPHISMVLD